MVNIITTITAKIQIYVSDKQAESLKITANAYRKACNWLSKYIFETKTLNQIKLNNLYYKQLRNLFGLKSQMAQSVMKTVIARYKSAKSNGNEWSLIEFKLPEYDLVWNRDYSLTQNQFSLNTLDGRLRLNYERKCVNKTIKLNVWKVYQFI